MHPYAHDWLGITCLTDAAVAADNLSLLESASCATTANGSSSQNIACSGICDLDSAFGAPTKPRIVWDKESVCGRKDSTICRSIGDIHAAKFQARGSIEVAAFEGATAASCVIATACSVDLLSICNCTSRTAVTDCTSGLGIWSVSCLLPSSMRRSVLRVGLGSL